MFHLTYELAAHPEGIAGAAVPRGDGCGACDAVLWAAVALDGLTPTITWVSVDGRTGEPMPPIDIWAAWVQLAQQLANTPELPDAAREACALVWSVVAGAFGTVPTAPHGADA